MYQIPERAMWVGAPVADREVVDARVVDAADQSFLEHRAIIVRETVVVADVVVFGGDVGPRDDVGRISSTRVCRRAVETAFDAFVAERRPERQPARDLAVRGLP